MLGSATAAEAQVLQQTPHELAEHILNQEPPKYKFNFDPFLRKHVSGRSHTVYLPSPTAAVQQLLDLQTGRMLKVLSHYVAERASFTDMDPTLPLGLVNAKGDIVTVVPTATAEGLIALFDTAQKSKVTAFKPGFRMLTGDANIRTRGRPQTCT